MNSTLENFYLVNDRLIIVKDYVTAFNVSYPTASKMHRHDRDELVKRVLMYSDFWRIYSRFPDEEFLPDWQEITLKKISNK